MLKTARRAAPALALLVLAACSASPDDSTAKPPETATPAPAAVPRVAPRDAVFAFAGDGDVHVQLRDGSTTPLTSGPDDDLVPRAAAGTVYFGRGLPPDSQVMAATPGGTVTEVATGELPAAAGRSTAWVETDDGGDARIVGGPDWSPELRLRPGPSGSVVARLTFDVTGDFLFWSSGTPGSLDSFGLKATRADEDQVARVGRDAAPLLLGPSPSVPHAVDTVGLCCDDLERPDRMALFRVFADGRPSEKLVDVDPRLLPEFHFSVATLRGWDVDDAGKWTRGAGTTWVVTDGARLVLLRPDGSHVDLEELPGADDFAAYEGLTAL